MQLEFKKIGKKWYVDLPEWDGNTAELEMVMGADTMLDCISILKNGERNITTHISDVPKTFNNEFNGKEHKYFSLSILEQDDDGATYLIDDYGMDLLKINSSVIWLCNVTKFVFNGEFPTKLYVAFEIK